MLYYIIKTYNSIDIFIYLAKYFRYSDLKNHHYFCIILNLPIHKINFFCIIFNYQLQQINFAYFNDIKYFVYHLVIKYLKFCYSFLLKLFTAVKYYILIIF